MTPVRTRRIIDDAGAEAVLAAGERKAREQDSRVVMAVVDPWGEVVALRRTEGAQAASSRVAVDKARTAAIFVRPSREMEQQVTDGRLGALALHGAACLTGGIPLTVDGEVVGAIGTSGETPDEDEAISIAAAAAVLSTVAVPALTYEGARRIAEAAGAAAADRGVAPVISVVDAGGALMYLVRPDAAQVASVEVTTDKARTAAIYRRPSKDFEDQASGGRPSALHLARAVPLQGGMPIVLEGEVVGAIGVSGARSADEDQELAVIGVGSSTANGHRNGVAHFPRAQVDSGRGILLDEGRFKLDAGRRTGPGEVELHEHAIDVMHVVKGTATVVTGGDTPHEIAEGDVLTIPAGVTHQFTAVSDPFLYFVVKVED
jgi:glc operon protein GlcG